jgi:starvation-inducible DNA-binding protein
MNPRITLTEKLATLLSSLVTSKFLAHGYHWNVKGKDFKEFHAFFEEIYSDFDEAIDPTAENIRKLGFDAPYMLEDFLSMSIVKEDRIDSGDIETMVTSLVRINEELLNISFSAFEAAQEINEQGIMNFLAERIDSHRKWDWQLKATLGLR